MDEVFKALADPTRRELLDELFRVDGQSLGALEGRIEGMTRFGVMKHLAVLEAAGLVTARRQGREKLHFLNPVPIRLAHDRWVSKYAEPWAAGLSALKSDLEDQTMAEQTTVEQTAEGHPAPSWANGSAPVADGTVVFEVFIKTTPEALWAAITDPRARAKYSFGMQVHSDWQPGSAYTGGVPDRIELVRGENLVVEPPRRLIQSFEALWGEDVRAQGVTRVSWEIEPVGTSCRLTVVHDRLPEHANAQLYGGWPMILSGLKTLLESGETLDTPGSLQYAGPPAE